MHELSYETFRRILLGTVTAGRQSKADGRSEAWYCRISSSASSALRSTLKPSISSLDPWYVPGHIPHFPQRTCRSSPPPRPTIAWSRVCIVHRADKGVATSGDRRCPELPLALIIIIPTLKFPGILLTETLPICPMTLLLKVARLGELATSGAYISWYPG